MFKMVVLPQPEGPTTATNWPAGIDRLTESRARTREPSVSPPNTRLTSRSSTAGAGVDVSSTDIDWFLSVVMHRVRGHSTVIV